jgi:outer membrane protein assembly factor BamA
VPLKNGAIMRATNKFHKRSLFSNIAVEMNPDEINEYVSDNGVCFAQVKININIS